MEQYVSVQEFSRLTGKSDSYIRRLCRENKLPYLLEQVPGTTNQRYKIDITSPEAEKQLDSAVLEAEPVEQSSESVPDQINSSAEQGSGAGQENAEPSSAKSTEPENNYSGSGSEVFLDLVGQIRELSEKSGKLEDIQNREKENAEYWKNLYEQRDQQVTELNKEVAELNKQIGELSAELKFRKTFFGRFIK